METIGVVVLNYKNYHETIKCVDSLLSQDNIDLRIVIVDNGSSNESVSKLTALYYSVPFIKIIELNQNVGFANGMNAGISFLTELGIKNIFICNSDLVFTKTGIMEQIASSEQFRDKRVAVINPLILNVDDSKATCIYFKDRYIRLRMLKTFFPLLDKIKAFFQKKEKADYPSNNKDNKEKQSKNRISFTQEGEYSIVGSGYLLTDCFFDYYNGLYPKTFLYNEEYALILFLKACGLKTSFVETDIIRHKHGASTGKVKRKYSSLFVNNSIIRLIMTPNRMIQRKYGKR